MTVREPIAEVEREIPPRLRMTEEEFVEWCDEDIKAEWVDGEVIVASPASIQHVRLANFLVKILGPFVERRGLGEVFGPEAMIRFATLRRRRVPDLFFIAGDRLSLLRPNHFEGAPDLIVEIVSPDSVSRDWRTKYLEYESAGVREYWVIDPLARQVEAYALGDDKQYSLIEEKDGAIRSTVLTGFCLKPAWLWEESLPGSLDILKELGVL
ncbi:MAG: Uma2 family endonuclease [Chloroflexi bacterium]|nr:Uma2 family endonuclease [Chloroflexota bacterium]MBI3763416.1 Uma2 family endonuclease [Chloroflexota bacterium]